LSKGLGMPSIYLGYCALRISTYLEISFTHVF
jgi:hypothetical protein